VFPLYAWPLPRCLQDVWIGGIIIAYKTCVQATKVQHHTVDHSQEWLAGDVTR
jgi:hypothetical protein